MKTKFYCILITLLLGNTLFAQEYKRADVGYECGAGLGFTSLNGDISEILGNGVGVSIFFSLDIQNVMLNLHGIIGVSSTQTEITNSNYNTWYPDDPTAEIGVYTLSVGYKFRIGNKFRITPSIGVERLAFWPMTNDVDEQNEFMFGSKYKRTLGLELSLENKKLTHGKSRYITMAPSIKYNYLPLEYKQFEPKVTGGLHTISAVFKIGFCRTK